MTHPLPLTPNAIEMFVRPTARARTFMVCGYATRLPQEPEALSIFAGRRMSDLGFVDTQALVTPADPADNIANIITSQNFVGARPGTDAVIMQIVPRKVFSQPHLVMFAGVIQDLDSVLPSDFDDNAGAILSGERTPFGVSMEMTERDVSWTPGQNLGQILTHPIWELGAPDRWASTWGLREDIAAIAEEGRAIRRRMLTGWGIPEDDARMQEIKTRTSWAVMPVGHDTSFDRFESAFAEMSGDLGPRYGGITTHTEAEQMKEIANQVVRAQRAPDTLGW